MGRGSSRGARDYAACPGAATTSSLAERVRSRDRARLQTHGRRARQRGAFMRNLGIALGLLLAAGTASAQGRFEGTVTFKMNMPGGRTMNVTMAQRGNK